MQRLLLSGSENGGEDNADCVKDRSNVSTKNNQELQFFDVHTKWYRAVATTYQSEAKHNKGCHGRLRSRVQNMVHN